MDDYMSAIYEFNMRSIEEQIILASNFDDHDLIQHLQAFTINRIGEDSHAGEVYDIGDPRYVMKIVVLNDYTWTNKGKLSKMHRNGSIIYMVPNSVTNKTTVFAPNYITEGIIGVLLGKELSKITPSIPRTVGFLFNEQSGIVYTFMEKLDSLNDYVVDSMSYIFAMFDILFGLNNAQRKGRFTHYDLHSNNIMARKVPSGIVNVYAIDNGKFLYSRFPFNAVIIDFGHARYESGEKVYTPKLDWEGLGMRAVADWYYYNQYYDIFSLLYSNYDKLNKGGFPRIPGAELDGTKEAAKQLLKMFFRNFNMSDAKLNECIGKVLAAPASWRPKPQELLFRFSMNASQMINEIAEKIHTTSSQNFNVVVLDTFKKNDGYRSILYHTVSMSQSKYSHQIAHKISDKTTSWDGISIRTYEPLIDEGVIKPYHHTPYTKEDKYENQLIHVVEFDQKEVRSKGYKFRFDCCALDLKDYFRHDKFESGVAINASYFRIHEHERDYTPIGFFRNSTLVYDRPVPKDFEKYYGYIALSEGKLVINKDRLRYYDDIVQSGPMLVWGGEVVFTEKMILKDKHEVNGVTVPTFQCRTRNQFERETQLLGSGKDTLYNCAFIKPGELYHAGNPNPRSAICTTIDDNVFFVYVEGRGLRGPGMDMAQLAEYCKSIGAHRAINLDSGRSSEISWKYRHKDLVYISNMSYEESYPRSSIISLVKEK